MNQIQRRQKRARIRQQQKRARLAKRPQSPGLLNLQELIVLVKRTITDYEGYVAKDAKNIASFKFLLRVMLLFYVMHIIFSVCLWKKGDDVLIIMLGSGVLIFFSIMYFGYKKGTRHWVVDLEEIRKYLEELKLRLSTT